MARRQAVQLRQDPRLETLVTVTTLYFSRRTRICEAGVLGRRLGRHRVVAQRVQARLARRVVFISDEVFLAAKALSLLLVVPVLLHEVLRQLQVVQEDGGTVRTFPKCGGNGDHPAGGSRGLGGLRCASMPRTHLKDSRQSADSPLCHSPADWAPR